MKHASISTIFVSVFLLTLAGCAGNPQTPVALRAGDPHSTNPDRIICRQPPPSTGSHISQDKEICHTYAQWQQIEKQSQEIIHHGQRQPGQSGGS